MFQLFDHTAEAIFVVNNAGRILYANRATAVYGGKPIEETRGNLLWKVFPDSVALYIQEFQRAVREQIPLTIEFYFPPVEKLFDVRFYPSTDAVAIFVADITERKHAEEITARFTAIVESSDDAILSKDLDGVITSWNTGAERLFGYTAQEAIGQCVKILIPPDLFDQVHPFGEEPDIMERILRGERVTNYETVRRRKDGTLIDVSLTVSPLMDSKGRIVGASKIARDITERKHAAAAVHDAEEKYRLLIEIVDQGFCLCEIIYDAKGRPIDHRYLEVNPAFETMTGLADAAGKTASEMIPGLENWWSETYAEVAVTGMPLHFQRYLEPLNRTLDVFVSATGDNRVMILFTDITAHVHQEQEREELNDSLRLSGVRQQEMTAIAQDLNTRLRRSMQETHHRVKNNLQVIASLVEIQAHEVGNEIVAVPLLSIQQHIQALTGIHELLTQQAAIDGDMEHLGTQSVLDRMLPLLRSTIGNRNIIAHTNDIILTTPKVASFALLVSECISNAVKHAQGEIEIRLKKECGRAILEICDDGDGFPTDFDPRKAANTGLQLIESTACWDLRGDVKYDNQGKGGGRVTITFPVDAYALP